MQNTSSVADKISQGAYDRALSLPKKIMTDRLPIKGNATVACSAAFLEYFQTVPLLAFSAPRDAPKSAEIIPTIKEAAWLLQASIWI